MKKLMTSFAALLLLFGVADAQSKKVVTDTLWVDGVCGMCKKRIETAVMYSKGVQSASYNIDTETLTISWRSDKTDKQKIAGLIAEAGHDNSLQKATDEAYDKVHKCCRYRSDVKH
jgi:copper chaperone CopZ